MKDLISAHARLSRIDPGQIAHTYLVQPVGECVLATGCSAQHPPVVDNELMSAWGSLAFRHDLQRSNDFNCRLECEGECFVRLRDLPRQDTLEEAGAVSEDDEDDLLLVAQAVHPA